MKVRKYLTEVRHLSIDVCVRYGVGYSLIKFLEESSNDTGTGGGGRKWSEQLCLTFPWLVKEQDLPLLSDHTDGTLLSECGGGSGSGSSGDGGGGVGNGNGRGEGLGKLITLRLKHRSIETKGRQRLMPKGGIWVHIFALLHSTLLFIFR